MEIKIYHPQFLEAIQSIQLSEEDARYTKHRWKTWNPQNE